MLSSEGMQRQRTVKNNNRSNYQKSNFACAVHFSCTFLCRCFARLQRETSRNFLVTRFMEEMSYVFSFTFFFTSAHFHLALVAASISHFVTATTTFSCCSSNKKMFFSSRSRSLSPLKPGCHMSEKSQTIGDFAFCRPSQILPMYRIIARSLSQILERRHVSL